PAVRSDHPLVAIYNRDNGVEGDDGSEKEHSWLVRASLQSGALLTVLTLARAMHTIAEQG
ncbi:MAG: hypothetical protein ACOYON_15005, partial [Fimbriimonas sp.]